MASQARTAQGTFLEIEDPNALGTFVHVAELLDIAGPNRSRDKKDVTSHDSPLGIKEFRPGNMEPGEIKSKMFYVPDDPGQILVEDAFLSNLTPNWRLLVNSGGVTIEHREGLGYVATLGDAFPSNGDMMMRDFGLQCSGNWPKTLGAP